VALLFSLSIAALSESHPVIFTLYCSTFRKSSLTSWKVDQTKWFRLLIKSSTMPRKWKSEFTLC